MQVAPDNDLLHSIYLLFKIVLLLNELLLAFFLKRSIYMSTSSLYGCLLLLVFFISKLLLSTNSLKTPRKLCKAPLIGPPLIRPKTKSQGSLKDLLQNLSEPEQFSDINAIMSLNKELNKYKHKKITVNSA